MPIEKRSHKSFWQVLTSWFAHFFSSSKFCGLSFQLTLFTEKRQGKIDAVVNFAVMLTHWGCNHAIERACVLQLADERGLSNSPRLVNLLLC